MDERKATAVSRNNSPSSRGMFFNSAWNYIGAGSAVMLTLVTTPTYLSYLGLERFGILAVIMALIGPLAALNSGTTQSAVKFVAEYTAADDPIAARATTWATVLVNVVVGLIGLGLFFVLADWLVDDVFRISVEVAPEARTAVRIAGLIWLVSQINQTFRGVLTGFRAQHRVVLTDVSFQITQAAVCTVLLWFRPRIDLFVFGQFLVSAVWLLLWSWLAWRCLGGWRVFGAPLRPHFRDVGRYSSWQFVNSLFGVIAGVADKYVVGILISTVALGAYNVALQGQMAARMLIGGVTQALFPAASAAGSKKGVAEHLTLIYTWRLMFSGGSAIGFIYIAGPAFLHLWVGSAVALQVGTVMRWMLLAALLEIPSATCGSYLYSKGRNRPQAIVNIYTSLLTLGVMYSAGRFYGLNGIAASGAVALAVTRIPFHLSIFRSYFRDLCSWDAFALFFYGNALLITLGAMLGGWWFDTWFSWWPNYVGFAFCSLVIGAAYALGLIFAVFAIRYNRHQSSELVLAVRQKTQDLPLLRRIISIFAISFRLVTK